MLYGQVSHDCTVSQSSRMVHNELKKSRFVNAEGEMQAVLPYCVCLYNNLQALPMSERLQCF